jgi:hypothetical protein
MFTWIKNLFKHKCENNATVKSYGWNETSEGIVYNYHKDMECLVCGKKWRE